MESSFNLGNRIKERFLDYMDWVDFRPDPACWPVLVGPALCLASVYTIGLAETIVLVVGAVGLALCVAALFLIAGAAWIVANALADLALAGLQELRVGGLVRQA